MVAELYEHTKTQWIVHSKWVIFCVYQLYLHKIVKTYLSHTGSLGYEFIFMDNCKKKKRGKE